MQFIIVYIRGPSLPTDSPEAAASISPAVCENVVVSGGAYIRHTVCCCVKPAARLSELPHCTACTCTA
jgi:hypothetical protein